MAAHPYNQQADAVHHQCHYRHHRYHGAVYEQRIRGEVLIGLVETFLLKGLCGKGADDHQAGEMLAADKVQLVDELLHFLEARQRHHEQHQNDTQHHNERQQQDPCHGHTLGKPHNEPAHAHDRCKAHHAKAHGKEHLNLGDVVGGAGDEAGSRELVQLAGCKVCHAAEYIAAQVAAHARAHACKAEPGRNGACREQHGEAQHLKTLYQDIICLHGVGICAKLHIKAFGKHAGRLLQRHVRRSGGCLDGILHCVCRKLGQHGQKLGKLPNFKPGGAFALCRGTVLGCEALHHLNTGVACA